MVVQEVTYAVSKEKPNPIAEQMVSNATLTEIMGNIRDGWPCHHDQLSIEAQKYCNFRDELSVIWGMVMKGPRVFIPSCLRDQMIFKVHKTHIGWDKRHEWAGISVFKPSISKVIDHVVDQCEACQKYHPSQVRCHPILSWCHVDWCIM